MQVRGCSTVVVAHVVVDDGDVEIVAERYVVEHRRCPEDDEEAADQTRIGQVHRHVGGGRRQQVRQQRTDTALAVPVSWRRIFNLSTLGHF